MSLVVAESLRCTPKLSAATGAKCTPKLSGLAEIDAERKRLKITDTELSRASGFNPTYFGRLRKRGSAKREYLTRLRAGLRQATAQRRNRGTVDEAMILATFNVFLINVAPALGHDVAAIRAQLSREGQCTADKAWRAASHVRQAAIYLTNTALGVPQFRLARALDLTAAAVCLAIRAVEDRRDDENFDAVLNQTEQLVTGRE